MKFDNGIKYAKAPITLECSLNDASNIINSLDCSLKAKFEIRTGIKFVKKPMFRLCEMQFKFAHGARSKCSSYTTCFRYNTAYLRCMDTLLYFSANNYRHFLLASLDDELR